MKLFLLASLFAFSAVIHAAERYGIIGPVDYGYNDGQPRMAWGGVFMRVDSQTGETWIAHGVCDAKIDPDYQANSDCGGGKTICMTITASIPMTCER